MLNSLYGLFGRSHDNLKPYYVSADNYIGAQINKEVLAEININSKLSLLLVNPNEVHDISRELAMEAEMTSSEFNLPTKTNVAIAAAVTSYARIHMIPLLINDSVLYSDTDSIFTTEPLKSNVIGPNLGQLKNELEGIAPSKSIDGAYFLGPKQYGYKYIDLQGNNVERSVWAGVPRDSLSFKEISLMAEGQTLETVSKDRFFRNLSDLKITVKDIKLSLSRSSFSKDNCYHPVNIDLK
jgi:hypothetical protein